ncbi:RNA cytosine-C(5)-methyltransferase NSUN2-like isoform X2 [Macadamia integrifolia]|uniref:RNA cytosine-C(5)-methyltransferase NSUN2-like isoform X2 n=1 Tax=Macadamia integrifolia TaxID=60698 RepID=UPI001C4FE48E|nr:RNA cytosine-C(5)-methyltransferase NSUN2-like isoform X2 [Macadamia integrifolia]
MGGKRGRTQRKHFRNSRENVWKKNRSDNPSSDNSSSELFAAQNLAFEEYYKEQGIVPQEEWDVYMEMLRKSLPAAFRINSSGQFFKDIRSQLENDFMKSLEAEVPDGELEAIRPLPWYPQNLGWHSNFSRMQLRKNQTLERFHEFLKQENEIGNITRQEAVSMVPPLFLDVHPHHFVLDMCAAPGSKTFQLLEIIHQSTEPGFLPDGMVIANDVDIQRCNLLIHQTKRMCSANLIVTNHEAQYFPRCHSNKNCLDISETESFEDPMISQLLFDSVLCDVPCSGDGTLRKAPDLWRKWNAGMGNALHRLQVQIAMRGIRLLKVRGRMVYSTCSMNPVENEAVVAEILRRCGGSVELLDVSSELPQLIRRPGLKKWKVRDKGIWLASYKDVPRYRRVAIVPSMFPSGSSSDTGNASSDGLQEDTGSLEDLDMGNSPSSGKRLKNGSNIDCEEGFGQLENFVIPTVVSDDEVSSLPLERCMRILPHDQNTGAFFIAVFHKLSPLPATLENQGQFASGKMELPKKLADELIEDTNESEINPSEDGGHHQYSEVTSDADLRGKQSEEGALEPDSNGIHQEKEPEESDIYGDGETSLESSINVKRKIQIQGKWRGVDPVVFFRDDTIISSIKAFYGVNESFPLDGHLVTRNPDPHHVKRIYYISKPVQDVLKLNFQAGQHLKITSIGLKTFERQTSREGTSTECAFRISSEALPLLLPYITKQILCASLVDFKHLLQYKSIRFADFVDAEFGEKASKLKLGCCIFVLRKGVGPSDPIQVDASTIAIGCWKGNSNISVLVTAIDCKELLQRLPVQSGNEKDYLSLEVDVTRPTDDDLDVNQEPGTIEQVPIG